MHSLKQARKIAEDYTYLLGQQLVTKDESDATTIHYLVIKPLDQETGDQMPQLYNRPMGVYEIPGSLTSKYEVIAINLQTYPQPVFFRLRLSDLRKYGIEFDPKKYKSS